jgi:cytoskeletal protein CcmA (bactofilin family)
MKKTEDMIAFLGKGTEYEGRLTFDGTVRIDGHFKGEISAVGTLIVGEGALVEADIHISQIMIRGEIRGNIVADHRIEINPPGKAFGDVQAPTVVIDEGGVFEGNCRMRPIKEPDGRKLAAFESGERSGDSSPPLGIIHGVVTGHTIRAPDAAHEPITAGEDEKQVGPIKEAKVSAKCRGFAEKNTSTDDSGFYELTDLEDGMWKLKVEADDHEVIKATVEVSGGGIYTQDFEYTVENRKSEPDF